MRILVYGYGNPGRQDDGLGIELVTRLEKWAAEQRMEGIRFDNNYQLNIEDADAISEMDLVFFADASEEDIDDYCLSRVDGKRELAFTTHAASPAYIVKLCQELFHKDPLVYLVHIKGYEWSFTEGLSPKAEHNLAAAFKFMTSLLENPEQVIKSNQKAC
jgi:hydrogenase maturation protease